MGRGAFDTDAISDHAPAAMVPDDPWGDSPAGECAGPIRLLGCTALCRTRGFTMRSNATARDAARDERLEARVTRAQKALFTEAASVQGRSLTAFMVAVLEEQ